ncbi:serine/threonine-protein kinase PAK 5 isoform X3 [Carassius gibelio]|uniref:serine/threonine-protein kinase PAK 5 isoform X3 n=1 Tax=Carassius gibelio TaxID=101364 RepID=UPI00227821D9|nr:serine/threonine-protein kinase PAK 5 isoform X3 [Carassius gibelio]XP_052445318.1 serine/threonine-protein kinase PAK 5 isoform X3 [Carassius gibelio]
MGDLTMHDYHKLSGESDDSGYSNRSIEKPPSFNAQFLYPITFYSDCKHIMNYFVTEAKKLSGESDDSGYSNRSIEQPPSFSEVLQKHGYTFKEELGRGATGIVFLVDEGEGNHVVVKQMNSRDRNELDTVTKEMKILKEMIHGYIVSYVDSFEDEQSGLYCIVMEYCAGGDLKKKMETQKEKGFFEEQQILDWFVQICLALQYIHKNNVLHRDIRPENVFLTEDGFINLGDFGCSKMLERDEVYAESAVVLRNYSSPEVYQKKQYNSKSDIWSLGWLLHDLCMLDVWSNNIKRLCAFTNSMEGTLPHISERYSWELQELIRQMLSCDPKDRPSAEEILEKPFLEDAVKRNKRIPEALEQRFTESTSAFDEAYNKHYKEFEILVSKWGKTADVLEEAHYNATAASLSGAVIGAAGGIAVLAGAILAPFTLGASLIVSAVGAGVGAAGGVIGAGANIADAVEQKKYHEKLKQLKPSIEKGRELIRCSLELRRLIETNFKFRDFASTSTSDNVRLSWEIGKGTIVFVTGLSSLGVLGNFIRIALQSAKMGRAAAAAAAAGVFGGLLVIADAVFIAKDSQEIHQMRNQWKTDDPEKVSSSVLKATAEIRKTHKDLFNVLEEIKKTRATSEEMRKRERKVFRGDRDQI